MTTARAIGLAALAAAALLPACTAAPQPARTPAPQAAPPAAAPASEVISAEFEIAGDQVRGPSGRITAPLGSTVRITVRGDKADELHVHGYDKAAQLTPGVPATAEFRADIPGVFEIELHHSGAALPSLEVR